MIIRTRIAAPVGRAISRTCFSNNFLRKFELNARPMSSSSSVDDVLFEDVNGKGIFTLNRPKALNSLNLSMVTKILPSLQRWENEKTMVIVKGAGDKAFCAGGDVREVTVASKNKETSGKEFFRNEYTMNHVIGTYKIPYIALVDGITMGGGVGISVHGWYVVATEKTLFAMPETQIGLFPDVGGTYKLSRLPNNIGIYLALTGARLKGYETVQAGIATHYCPSEKIPDLVKALIESNDPESVLKRFCITPEKTNFSLEPHLQKINNIFNADSIEGILAKLKEDGSEWANNTAATLSKMCPLSLKVSLEAVIRGRKLNLADCLRMEYRLANACCDGHNFIEGVRALLIDKDQNPQWKPDNVNDVTREMVEDFFNYKPYKGDLELRSSGEGRGVGSNPSRGTSKL